MRLLLTMTLATLLVVGCYNVKGDADNDEDAGRSPGTETVPSTGVDMSTAVDTASDQGSDSVSTGDTDGDGIPDTQVSTSVTTSDSGSSSRSDDTGNDSSSEDDDVGADTDVDTDSDSDSDSEGDPDEDEDTDQEPECEEGTTRCVGNILEMCEDGAWEVWSDCTVFDFYCGVFDGKPACLIREMDTETGSDDPVGEDAGVDGGASSDNDTGPDTGSDTVERIDTSNCNENICSQYPEDCIANFENGTLGGVDEDNIGFVSFGDDYGEMFPYTDFDRTGPAAVMADEGCTPWAMCLTSTEEFIEWGASIALFWGSDGSDDLMPAPRDVSAYRGIGFWTLRRSGVNTIRVQFPSPYSFPDFGYCDDNGGCWNDYAAVVIMDNRNVWEYKEILFEDLRPALSWGYQPPEGTPFPEEESLGIRISVGDSVPFDFCIDELRFI